MEVLQGIMESIMLQGIISSDYTDQDKREAHHQSKQNLIGEELIDAVQFTSFCWICIVPSRQCVHFLNLVSAIGAKNTEGNH